MQMHPHCSACSRLVLAAHFAPEPLEGCDLPFWQQRCSGLASVKITCIARRLCPALADGRLSERKLPQSRDTEAFLASRQARALKTYFPLGVWAAWETLVLHGTFLNSSRCRNSRGH
jgi:hypothetical protein